jgi:hypothetical protein
MLLTNEYHLFGTKIFIDFFSIWIWSQSYKNNVITEFLDGASLQFRPQQDNSINLN